MVEQNETAPQKATSSEHRVVIAEDEPDLRTLIEMAFAADGRIDRVTTVSDGRSLVDVVAALRPDAIVLDLSLPELDGVEALPELFAAVPDLKVVVFSGIESTEFVNRIKRRGVAAYVAKSADLKSLVRSVINVLNDDDAAPAAS